MLRAGRLAYWVSNASELPVMAHADFCGRTTKGQGVVRAMLACYGRLGDIVRRRADDTIARRPASTISVVGTTSRDSMSAKQATVDTE